MTKQLFTGECTHGWCQASTRRLLLKLAYHKPAGLAKHFHLMCLVDLLNHIYEDETDIIFEDYLNEESLIELRKRRSQPTLNRESGLMRFPPRYSIRPNARQIQAKLNELYGMDIVEANESIPNELSIKTDYELPDYILDGPEQSELESNVTTPSPQPPVVAEKPASRRASAAATAKATPPTAVLTRRTRVSQPISTSAAAAQPQPQQPSSSSKRSADKDKSSKANDAELFPAPAPQRATRAAAAAAAASGSGKKRRGVGAPIASPSSSLHPRAPQRRRSVSDRMSVEE